MRPAMKGRRSVDGSLAGMLRDVSWREAPKPPLDRALMDEGLTGGHPVGNVEKGVL